MTISHIIIIPNTEHGTNIPQPHSYTNNRMNTTIIKRIIPKIKSIEQIYLLQIDDPSR